VDNRRRDGPASLQPPIDLDDERTKQMSNYIQLGDVHTYYEEDGAGEPLVLLHPDWRTRGPSRSMCPSSPSTSTSFGPTGAGTGGRDGVMAG
jgi:hypothetical protein